jgi:hypothetical protein
MPAPAPVRTTARPAVETPAVPATETAAVSSGEPPPMPRIGPVGPRRWPTSEASRHSGKSGWVADMSDRRSRSGCREAGGHVTATPLGPDGRECKDGRTDKERECGRREDDERRGRRNDDFGWWQDHDRRRHRCTEERADRRRNCPRGRSSNGWRSRDDRWWADIRQSGNNGRRCGVDRRRQHDQGRGDHHADRSTNQGSIRILV